MTKIPTGWKKTTLGDLISFGKVQIKNSLRKPISSNERSKIQGTYPYYGAASAIDFLNYFSVEGFHLLVAEDGTVVTNKNRPMLQLVDGQFNVSNHAHILQGGNKLETRFLYYLLSNVNILPYVTGAVQPKLSKENLCKISFLLPSLPEQQAIAKVLSSFDDKIDLLRAENQTLEQMGQELFKERFGKWKIGDELPEGWRVGKLGEMGTIICGKTPSKNNPDFFGGNIPFIKIPDMHGNLFILKTEDSLTEEGANSQKNKYIPEGAICVSCIATVGLISLITRPSQTNQQINSIIPSSNNYREYLYYTLIGMKNELLAMGAGGSATLNINTTSFSNIPIIIPNQETLSQFDLVIKPLFNKIRTNSEQIQSLSATRDQLLPKLMSGEVRVEF